MLRLKLSKTTKNCQKAVGIIKSTLEKEKSEIVEKIKKLKEEIAGFKKKKKLLDVKMKKDCEKKIEKEKTRRKSIITETKQKLNLVKKERSKLEKALEKVKTLIRLQEKAGKLEIESLATTGKETKKSIATKKDEIEATKEDVFIIDKSFEFTRSEGSIMFSDVFWTPKDIPDIPVPMFKPEDWHQEAQLHIPSIDPNWVWNKGVTERLALALYCGDTTT